MGVDTYLWLPGNVSLGNVAKVMGALHGNARSSDLLAHDDSDTRVTAVSGISTQVIEGIPEMCHIVVDSNLTSETLTWNWHWECEPIAAPACTFHSDCKENPDIGLACWKSTSSVRGRRMLSARSHTIHILTARRLAAFFGGVVQYQDCKSEVDYVVSDRSDDENWASDGEPWNSLQRRIFELNPFTQKEFDECIEFAAYPVEQVRTKKGELIRTPLKLQNLAQVAGRLKHVRKTK